MDDVGKAIDAVDKALLDTILLELMRWDRSGGWEFNSMARSATLAWLRAQPWLTVENRGEIISIKLNINYSEARTALALCVERP